MWMGIMYTDMSWGATQDHLVQSILHYCHAISATHAYKMNEKGAN